MIAAIVWKEWREQRTIAMVVLSFAALALTLTAQFVDPMRGAAFLDNAGARELMGPALVFLAGIVCGAILLADEKEVGTFEFLDSLPCHRRSLWVGKVIFGTALTCCQSTVIVLLAFVLNCLPPSVAIGPYWFAMIFVGLLAFAWGIFGGALARSTLGAVLHGAIGAFVIGICLAIPAAIIVGPRSYGLRYVIAWLGYLVLWVGIGLVMSGIVFTRLDRRRTGRWIAQHRGATVTMGRQRKPGFGIRALLWLSTRQAVFVTFASLAAGLIVGATMLHPESYPFLVWPAITLSLGVLAGVTTLGEEQTRGIARFWAERRLPLGRMWLMKTLTHFGIALLAAVVTFIPIYIASPGIPFRTQLLGNPEWGLRAELPRYVLLALVYGFVAGHLAGMLFRKTVVAGLVAAVISATLVGLIAPSLLCGGASSWQIWAPALILLVTARLLLYPWATDRIATSGPVLRVAGGSVLAVATLAGSIFYRVYEIPDVSDELAESHFEDRLPPKDTSDIGRQARSTVLQYRQAANNARQLYPAVEPRTANSLQGPSQSVDETDALERALRTNSPTDIQRLKPWLEQVFGGTWTTALRDLDGKPTGVFEDPRDLDYLALEEDRRNLREMIVAIRIRGMQRLAEGSPEVLVELLPGGLAACRSARYMTGWLTPIFAHRAEEILLDAITDWLMQLDGHTELLKSLLDVLKRHEREMAIGTEDAFWASRLILRNTMQRVGNWLPQLVDPRFVRGSSTTVSGQAEAEGDVVGMAWAVPWERVRRERLLRMSTHIGMPIDASLLSGVHLRRYWRIERGGQLSQLADWDRRGLTHRRAAMIQVAVRLYQLEHKEPLQSLAQLVPEYLPEVPIDPYSAKLDAPIDRHVGNPFMYRLSRGEIIEIDVNARTADLIHATATAQAITLYLARSDGIVQMLSELQRISRPAEQTTPGTSSPVMSVNFGVVGMGVGSRPARTMPAPRGASVFWSVGTDGTDNGGIRTPRRRLSSSNGQDWIFVVPLPRSRQ